MKEVLILGAARTPIGSFLGSLSSIDATNLGALAIEAALKKAKIAPELVDEVFMGQVLQGGCGQAPARQAALAAKIPPKTPCTTINKVCGSGLKSVMLAAQAIKLGEEKIVVAGGMESMSNAPYILPKARQGMRMGDSAVVDLLIHDGLEDPYAKAHMGTFGELCARTFGFSKEAQDEYAHKSYQKAIKAQEEGLFDAEIVPVSIAIKNEHKIISADEEPSRYMPEKFAGLRPAFDPKGSVTAANSSKLSDGAAALVLGSAEVAQELSLKPRARIVAAASFAAEPQWFTTAPVQAIKIVLDKASMSLSQIDCFEINEAFAMVAMNVIKELSLDADKVNIFGGAIALGHPIGCSGARTLVTLLNALEHTKGRFGCVSLCIGGGEAVALIVERL